MLPNLFAARMVPRGGPLGGDGGLECEGRIMGYAPDMAKVMAKLPSWGNGMVPAYCWGRLIVACRATCVTVTGSFGAEIVGSVGWALSIRRARTCASISGLTRLWSLLLLVPRRRFLRLRKGFLALAERDPSHCFCRSDSGLFWTVRS